MSEPTGYEKKKAWLTKQLRAYRQPVVGKISVNWTDVSFALNELEKAWAALEFYADKDNYMWIDGDPWILTNEFILKDGTSPEDVVEDGGKRARKVLEE
jgi:hypothetical protein